MKPQIIILTIILIGCSTTAQKNRLFENLSGQENVILFLSKYHLDSVPNEIGQLKNAKRLYITADTLGWTVYPPLSTLPQSANALPGKQLPNEITELTNLKYLGLVHLQLTRLPDNFGKLQNLDSLDLSMNKLVISNELEKLKQLKGLKFVNLTGNAIDSTAIKELKRNNPGLTILTWME